MTSNKALFKQMFLQKRRYANLVLLVQVFAVAFMFLMGIIFKGNSNPVNNIASGFVGNDNIWDLILGLGTITTFLADATFLGLMCWQNEKINLSQTWQLIPVSSIKLWWINIFTSLVECAYIFVIQVVLGIIVFVIDCLSYGYNIVKIFNQTSGFNSWSDYAGFFELIFWLIGLVLIIFCFVSFANFLTRTITDQLLGKNSTVIKIFVMAILVIVGVTIAFRINDQITTMYINHMMKNRAYSGDTFPMITIEYFVGSLILGIVNSYLVQKFVEPKIR